MIKKRGIKMAEKDIYFEKALIDHNGKEDKPKDSPLKLKRSECYEGED